MVTCYNCSGEGQVKNEETLGSPRVVTFRICKYCKGTGKTPR
jgi:DnaJ-class molecular chaperone